MRGELILGLIYELYMNTGAPNTLNSDAIYFPVLKTSLFSKAKRKRSSL